MAAATGPLDYVLSDWQAAGLRLPSAFKAALVTLEPSRVIHQIGTLTSRDLAEVSRRLTRALDL